MLKENQDFKNQKYLMEKNNLKNFLLKNFPILKNNQNKLFNLVDDENIFSKIKDYSNK